MLTRDLPLSASTRRCGLLLTSTPPQYLDQAPFHVLLPPHSTSVRLFCFAIQSVQRFTGIGSISGSLSPWPRRLCTRLRHRF